MSDPIEIVIYRWAGEKWGFRLRESCVECELAVAQARSVASVHPDWPIRVTVKPWLTHLGEALWLGGWHPPVLVVDGRRIRQGSVPTRIEIEAAVCAAAQRRGLASQGLAFPSLDVSARLFRS